MATLGRWERFLVVLALVAGVLAMHALVVPMAHEQQMPVAAVVAAHGDGMAPAADGPMPASPDAHGPMHLCLAVLAALLVLGAAVLAAALAGSRSGDAVAVAAFYPVGWPRPPPPTSVRLARLCVLRN